MKTLLIPKTQKFYCHLKSILSSSILVLLIYSTASGNEVVGPAKVLKKFIYENLGFSFQLPEEWQQLQSTPNDRKNIITLTFEPNYAEHTARPYNYKLLIIIAENPHQLTYEELFGLKDRRDLYQEYYSQNSNITVGKKSAKLIYDVPSLKDGPIAVIPFEKRYITIYSPKEGDFSDTKSFDKLLSTIVFFEPYGAVDNSQPIQKSKKDSLFEWCAKTPPLLTPGSCYAELARTEKIPDGAWCEAINTKNSGNTDQNGEPGFYYFYKNSCYENIAVKLKDIQLCDKMEGHGNFEINRMEAVRNCKARVNYESAISKNDTSFCNEIDVATIVNDDRGMSTVSYLYCYVDVAVKLNDQSVCDKLIPKESKMGSSATKEWCYYNYAVKKKDCSLVPPDSPAPKSQCESFVKNGI